jgi:hypothetical protein
LSGQQQHTALVNLTLERLTIRDGWMFWKMPTGLGRSMDGARVISFGLNGGADIIGCADGWFVAIECKVGRDALRKNQKNFRTAVLTAGGIHIVAYSPEEAESKLLGALDA